MNAIKKTGFENIKTRRVVGLIGLSLILFVASCEDFVTVPAPGTQLVQENVFKDDATALAALSSVYLKLADGFSFADGDNKSITLLQGLYADEVASFTPISSADAQLEFYFNNVSSLNALVEATWQRCYAITYESNRILEGLEKSTTLSSTLKQQLTGEAKFVLAFCHFYLVNLFGDVPLIITSDYRINAKVTRTPSNEVFEQIITDLLEAKNLLSEEYPSEGRVRVNRSAATALLARVYLYTGDFAAAELQASEIIDNLSKYELLPELNSVFLKNSKEAIWQLLPRGGAQNYTNEGFLFILRAPPTKYALRNEFYAAFETDDLRRTKWLDSVSSSSGLTKWYFAHKYKENFSNATGAEYSMVLRLAEQYLIRAEGRTRQNKLTGTESAESDINAIRNRAGLPNTTAASLPELLSAIEQERRVELFTEWGHRFFDLKRTGRLDAVLDPLKPNWESTDSLLPIPQSELLLNQNLKPQNPGYE